MDVSSSEEEREMRKNPTPSQKLLLFTYDTLLAVGKHYSEDAVKISRQILKDDVIVADHKPEMMELKKNLTSFIEKIEHNKKPKNVWDIMDIYTDTIDNYTDIPEDKQSPEAKKIMEVLEKYDSKEVTVKMVKELIDFMDKFEKMVVEYKDHLDKKMLDWYAKYKNLDDFEKKVDAFMEIFDMYDD